MPIKSFHKAHAYIHRLWILELMMKSSIITFVLFSIAVSSAFIHDKKQPEQVFAQNMIDVNDNFSAQVDEIGLETYTEEMTEWNDSVDELVPKSIEIKPSLSKTLFQTKPIISTKVAKLIQATSSSSVNLSKDYVVAE